MFPGSDELLGSSITLLQELGLDGYLKVLFIISVLGAMLNAFRR